MTVAALPASKDYVEDGVGRSFAVPYRFKSVGDLVVTRYFATGATTLLVLDIDYTVTGGDTDAGGTVMTTVAASLGTRIRIARRTPRVQAMSYTAGDRFPAASHEGALDTAMLIDQEQDVANADLMARSMLVPIGEVAPALPPLADSDGYVLGFSGGKALLVPNNAVAVAEDVSRAEAAAVDADEAREDAVDALGQITNLVAQNPRRVSKAVDTTILSTTALVSDADLTVPLLANALMLLRGRINYATGANGDFKWQHAGPAAPTSIQVNRRALAPGDAAYSALGADAAYSVADISITGGAGTGLIEFEATIKNVTAGNFVFKWAQNTSEAVATTVKAGSYIEYIALPTVTSFAFANTGIAAIGGFSPGSNSGHNFVSPNYLNGGNSRLETIVTGSKCLAQVFNTGTTPNYIVTVDGGAPYTVTAPATGWSFITLYDGLSDAPHRLTVTGGYIDSDISLRVTGTRPSVTRPSDLPMTYVLGAAPFTTYGAIDGLTRLNANIMPSPYMREWGSGSGWGMRFKATTTSVCLFHYNAANPSRIILLQDGIQIADVNPTGLGGGFQVLTLATGLSGSHEYEIKFIEIGRGTDAWQLLVDSLDTVTHTALPIDAHYGDSIAAGLDAATNFDLDARLGDAYLIAAATGHISALRGAAGAQVSTQLRDQVTSYITPMPVLPSRIYVTAGTNDMAHGVPVATFGADYQAMLANLRTAAPLAVIPARGILSRTGYTAGAGLTLLNNFNGAIAAAVSAIGDPNIKYVDTTGWIDPAVDTGDGLHPNPQGRLKMANAQLAWNAANL